MKNKKRSLRWQGLMGGYDRMTRRIVFVLLWILSATLSFTQLGFAGIGGLGEYSGYMVVLLVPITLSAMLLGPKASILTGLFTGAVALLHAKVMPLDYYEFTFVNVYSSVIAMTFMGFLLGLSFARIFRKDHPMWKYCLYVVLICIAASWIYNVGFITNVIISVLVYTMNLMSFLGTEELSASLQAQIFSMMNRTGNLSLQSWANACNMAVPACAALFMTAKVGPPSKRRTVRFVFNAALTVAAVTAFCLTSALCFVSISAVEFAQGSAVMSGELKYIADQLSAGQNRAMTMEAMLSRLEAEGSITTTDDSLAHELEVMLNQESILKGYVPEQDGYMFVGSVDNDYVYLNDVELDATEQGTKFTRMTDLLNADVMRAVQESLDTGNVIKAVYDHTYADTIREVRKVIDENGKIHGTLGNIKFDAGSELMYVMAMHNEESDDDIIMMAPSTQVFPTRHITMTAVTLAFGTLMALVFVVVSKLSEDIIVQRIQRINGVLTDIEGGNLNAKAEVRNTVEFDELSTHINTTVDALHKWISEAKKGMETELATAKAIQESAIPRIFPPYPDNPHFDIYATMNAAKDVGGDFYDFFLLGDDSNNEQGKLAFIMADVSGKGIPAAMFMMKAKTQIRDYLESGMEIDEAMVNVNHQLCQENDADMFVTAWVGILDYATGHIDFVNAGHNPPMLWRHETGTWEWLSKKSGLPLGLFDDVPYKTYSIDCLPGEILFLYTDGVTEALSADKMFFKEERLEDLLKGHCYEHPRELCSIVRRSVAEFTAGAEQSDDITMMALEVGVPPEITATLVVPADVAELNAVNEFIHTELHRRLCPIRVQRQIDIAVEELFVNICSYAYADKREEPHDKQDMVRISYTYSSDPPSVTISFSDEGMPYNPLDKPDAVTPANIADVPIGGLGILLAKKNVTNMEYERTGETNILTITKRW